MSDAKSQSYYHIMNDEEESAPIVSVSSHEDEQEVRLVTQTTTRKIEDQTTIYIFSTLAFCIRCAGYRASISRQYSYIFTENENTDCL